MSWRVSSEERRRKAIAKVMAIVLGLFVFLLFTLGPISIYRLANGVDLISKVIVPGELAVFIFSSSIGSMLVYASSYFILRFFGGYTVKSVLSMLPSKKKPKDTWFN